MRKSLLTALPSQHPAVSIRAPTANANVRLVLTLLQPQIKACKDGSSIINRVITDLKSPAYKSKLNCKSVNGQVNSSGQLSLISKSASCNRLAPN